MHASQLICVSYAVTGEILWSLIVDSDCKYFLQKYTFNIYIVQNNTSLWIYQ